MNRYIWENIQGFPERSPVLVRYNVIIECLATTLYYGETGSTRITDDYEVGL